MPQNPIPIASEINPSKVYGPSMTDANKVSLVSEGGYQSALNITAASVVKASPGRLCKIVVIAPGTTSGTLTINDLTTTTGGAAGNEIFSIGYAAMSAGQVIVLDWPCLTGIAVTAVPGGGSPQYNISFV